MTRYIVAQMDEIEPTPCPCGYARRAFASDDDRVATLHVTDISADARVHYHKKLTEIYLILEGQGYMELDGDRVPIQPMTTIMIKPGCRHRAVGLGSSLGSGSDKIRTAIAVIPAFDPNDEWFDD